MRVKQNRTKEKGIAFEDSSVSKNRRRKQSEDAIASSKTSLRTTTTTNGGQSKQRYRTFLLFNKRHRQEIEKANPTLSRSEINQKVAEAYRNLSKDEKIKLQRESGNLVESSQPKRSRSKHKYNLYVLYNKLHRPEFEKAHPNATLAEINQKVQQAYRSLSREEIVKLRTQAENLKESAPKLRKKHKWTMLNLFKKEYLGKIMKANPNLSMREIYAKLLIAFRNMKQEKRDELERQAIELDMSQAMPQVPAHRYGPFQLFYQQHYHEILEANPGIRNGNQDIMKKAREAYQKLSTEEEEKFLSQSRQLKETLPKKKKQPPNEYGLFRQEQYPSYVDMFPDKSWTDICRLMALEWEATPDEIKKKYKTQSQEAWDKYRKEEVEDNTGDYN